jgi:1-deoxy-D-xylulose-5-phosphate reductoisomerase
VRKIVILGSTGSIGKNALDVVDRNPDKLEVIGLAAYKNHEQLAHQINKYKPTHVTLTDSRALSAFKERFSDSSVTVVEDTAFSNALEEISSLQDADIVLNAIVGIAGLRATAAALISGKVVALANKESMVAAGPILNDLAQEHKGGIIPVDSEHSAIYQCFLAGKHEQARRLILTGSGGPFLNKANFDDITVEEALKHPNWKMGPKITIDSATMMNKALEIIEASYLFNLPSDKIRVMIHPQSIIHSMVEFIDGSAIAQLSYPDMRLPIQYALLYPERAPLEVCNIDWSEALTLDLRPPDMEKFRSLKLGYRALKEGGISPAVLNAANEAAVKAFLERRIKFAQIFDIIERTMDDIEPGEANDLGSIYRANMWATDLAEDFVHIV